MLYIGFFFLEYNISCKEFSNLCVCHHLFQKENTVGDCTNDKNVNFPTVVVSLGHNSSRRHRQLTVEQEFSTRVGISRFW